jgi:polar amino acid transport system substrate-binding protein
MMKIINPVIFLFLASFSFQAYSQNLNIVANIWPPYVDKTLEDNGLAMKIVKAAFEKVGYTPQIRFEKWERALEGSKLGVYDVAGAIWKSDSRKQKLLYSEPYLKNNIVLITSADSNIKFNSLNDLHGLLVGILRGYAYDEQFMKDPKILKVQANRLSQNLISLQAGKINVAVADRRLALYELKQFFSKSRNDFQFLPKHLSTRNLYVAAPLANKQSKAIIKKFNEGLAAIKKDGTYQKILDSYTF